MFCTRTALCQHIYYARNACVCVCCVMFLIPLQCGPSSQPSVQSGTPLHSLLMWMQSSVPPHWYSLVGHLKLVLCGPEETNIQIGVKRLWFFYSYKTNLCYLARFFHAFLMRELFTFSISRQLFKLGKEWRTFFNSDFAFFSTNWSFNSLFISQMPSYLREDLDMIETTEIPTDVSCKMTPDI